MVQKRLTTIDFQSNQAISQIYFKDFYLIKTFARRKLVDFTALVYFHKNFRKFLSPQE